MHEVLVNRLGGLSLPRKSVVRLTDRPDMTLDVYRGRKTTVQQQQQQQFPSCSPHHHILSFAATAVYYYGPMVQLTVKKPECQGQWFEPFVLCFFLFHNHFFLFLLIIYHYYYYYYHYCIFNYDSRPVACGGRVGRLCWVGQGPVMLAAGGRFTNLDNGRARAYCVRSRCGWRLFGYFFSRLLFLFSVWMDG